MDPIQLSSSKLNLFRECPRCFHDSYAGDTPRPRGIMASLPGGMDLIMKKYVDQFRGKLPPSLEGKLPGVLFEDMAQMKKWRYWKTGPSYQDKDRQIIVVGALDDCLKHGRFFIPLDWKSKGQAPKDDGSKYYQAQLDVYNLALDFSGFPSCDEGWLVYFHPILAYDKSQNITIDSIPSHTTPQSIQVVFDLTPYKLVCSRERAIEIIVKAAECLRGQRPKSAETCEHCQYLEKVALLSKQ